MHGSARTTTAKKIILGLSRVATSVAITSKTRKIEFTCGITLGEKSEKNLRFSTMTSLQTGLSTA